MKESHELQGIDMINSCDERINTLMTCLIDYKGFRVKAYADDHKEQCKTSFELKGNTPVTDELITTVLQNCGKMLNFKTHTGILLDNRKVTISIGSDVQVFHHFQTTISHYLGIFRQTYW